MAQLNHVVIVAVMLFSSFPGFEGRENCFKILQDVSAPKLTITMEIPPRELLSKPGEKPYRVDAKLYVKVIAKNDSDQRIRVRAVDPYYQNRPRLSKNGQLVAYRKEIAELIRSKDSDPQFM